MLIDWFTVGAQVLNFLILVWLLQHFLYKPILAAIDAREKRIADQFAGATAKQVDAQKEHDEFDAKNKAKSEPRYQPAKLASRSVKGTWRRHRHLACRAGLSPSEWLS